MRPIAGKTGTSDDSKDTWFIGYSPDVLCGVWVGHDSMTSLGANETGGKTACPIFVDFMTTALRDRPVRDFRVPAGVVFARVNSNTGKGAARILWNHVLRSLSKAAYLQPRRQLMMINC